MNADLTKSRWLLLLVLLSCAAIARLLLQALAMPPYAGFDELYHVARVAFTDFAGRSPHFTEPSIPVYLAQSELGNSPAPPAFNTVGTRWPEMARRARWANPLISAEMAGAVTHANYQAQQPAPYYLLASRLLPDPRRQLTEQLVLRLFSIAAALAVVLVTAALGWRLFGVVGFVSAVLLASTPTWLSLVVRAGNDALAVALLSGAILLSFQQQRKPWFWMMEAFAWAGALATKLYTWPAALLIPLLRWEDRQWARLALVTICCLIAAGVTMADLENRTGTVFGLQHFRMPATPNPNQFSLSESIKVFVSSAIWPGGPHGNALRPPAMLLYAGVLLVLASIGWLLSLRSAEARRLTGIVLAVLAMFVLAQAVHAVGFVRRGLVSAEGVALGGFEGWYIFSLGAILFGILGSSAFKHIRRWSLMLPAIVLWAIAWDVVIHEGALFRDYSGVTAPQADAVLFRWGPSPRFGGLANLERIGIPGVPAMLLYGLRAVHVVATIALTLFVIRWSKTERKRG